MPITQQAAAYVTPDEDDGPILARDCTCLTCRRARWWWSPDPFGSQAAGPAPRCDKASYIEPEHDSLAAHAGNVAFSFNRWLEKYFIATPAHRKRDPVDQERARLHAADIWCAWIEVSEIEQVNLFDVWSAIDDQILETAWTENAHDAQVRAIQSIQGRDAVFAARQRRFYQITGMVWADIKLEPWESVAEALSPAALELMLIEIEYDTERWREATNA